MNSKQFESKIINNWFSRLWRDIINRCFSTIIATFSTLLVTQLGFIMNNLIIQVKKNYVSGVHFYEIVTPSKNEHENLR